MTIYGLLHSGIPFGTLISAFWAYRAYQRGRLLVPFIFIAIVIGSIGLHTGAFGQGNSVPPRFHTSQGF